MLVLKKDMLVPEDTLDSLIDFIDGMWEQDADAYNNNSRIRFEFITDVTTEPSFYEGYISKHAGGELRVRPNTIAYARQIDLYAWDRMVAVIPSNKREKCFWLHPDAEAKLNKMDFGQYYYGVNFKERMKECIKISQQI